MVLNEFLKEHPKVEAQEQQSTITALKGVVARQQKQIETRSPPKQKQRSLSDRQTSLRDAMSARVIQARPSWE